MMEKRKMDKNKRREAIQNLLRQNPCLTDGDLAERFSVSVATIRLDRQTLGIPVQMRERMEQLVSSQPSESHEGVRVLDLDIGQKGVGLLKTTEEMADSAGMVSAEKLYGAAQGFAESLQETPLLPLR